MRILIASSNHGSASSKHAHAPDHSLLGHDITRARHEEAVMILHEGFDAVLMEMYGWSHKGPTSGADLYTPLGFSLLFAVARSATVKYVGIIAHGGPEKTMPVGKCFGWPDSDASSRFTINQATVGFFAKPLMAGRPGTGCVCRLGRACRDDGSDRTPRYEATRHLSHLERQKLCPLCEGAWSHCQACPRCDGTGDQKCVDWGEILRQLV